MINEESDEESTWKAFRNTTQPVRDRFWRNRDIVRDRFWRNAAAYKDLIGDKATELKGKITGRDWKPGIVKYKSKWNRIAC